MKASILSKLEGLSERLEEINALLGSPEVIADNDRFIALAKEYAELNPVVGCYSKYQAVLGELAADNSMVSTCRSGLSTPRPFPAGGPRQATTIT